MAWEARHFNVGVGEEAAYLIKNPKRNNKPLYSLLLGLFKKSSKRINESPTKKNIKG